VCVFIDLGTQREMCTRLMSSLAPPGLLYFSTLSHKRYDFRKTITERRMCILILSITFLCKISHSEKKRARYGQKCILDFM